RAGATPGVVAHAIDRMLSLAAGAGRQALRVARIELGGALGVERFEGPESVLRRGRAAAGKEVDQRAQAIDDTGEHGFTGGARRYVANEIGGFRALVRCTDTGDRGDQVRPYRGDIANGRAAVAMTYQVDLGLATDGNDLLDLGQQLLATGLRGIQLADLGDVDGGTVLAQGLGNTVPVVDTEDAVEAEHAMGQDDGVFGLGVIGGTEPERLGLAGNAQHGGQRHGANEMLAIHA